LINNSKKQTLGFGMKITEFNNKTAKKLNEGLAARFGARINVESFTLEQLQDARNKIRTQLSQIETNESYNSTSSEAYQKATALLDVLNTAISERAEISEAADDCDDTCPKSCPDCGGTGKVKTDEAAKPDFADLDKDGDKKEPMKKAAKDAKKKKTDEGKDIINNYYASLLKEGAEDHAELVMAAKDMVDRLTGWMEDTAEMQSESMLELADAIRDEMGAEQADTFTNTVKPALEAMYTTMETTRVSLTQGVGQITGEAEPADMMGAEDDAMPMDDAEADMEMPTDGDIDIDDFEADAAAAGGADEAGREKRESRINKKRAMLEQSRRLGAILSKKK
tara:strand:- start:890 stop:1903 length:1014 start_codon:yes stop_codon:yes gene_type:complete